ncbi:unnamed protein product [Meganyctiphanes norvegica]|uniref:Uncharacterized protein n=1 Tax=Meganyctiphanes norvegica TaxID=48144 RepID=A0AAV2S8Y4_MEGNR
MIIILIKLCVLLVTVIYMGHHAMLQRKEKVEGTLVIINNVFPCKHWKKISPKDPVWPHIWSHTRGPLHQKMNLNHFQPKVVCWMPFWVQCGACSHDYQVVIKLETMQDDEQFLFHIGSLKELQNIHEWRNNQGKKSSSATLASGL